MTEPVQIFETILPYLDLGYVDKVDTKKLFETGSGAMLRSLDPYTEFEGKQGAAELNIGLVISGAVPKKEVDTTEASQGLVLLVVEWTMVLMVMSVHCYCRKHLMKRCVSSSVMALMT